MTFFGIERASIKFLQVSECESFVATIKGEMICCAIGGGSRRATISVTMKRLDSERDGEGPPDSVGNDAAARFGAVAADVADAVADAVVGVAARPIVTAAKALVGSSPDERLAEARTSETELASMRLPALVERVARLELAHVGAGEQLTRLARQVGEAMMEPSFDLLEEILRLVRRRGLSWEEVQESDRFRGATIAAFKKVMLAADPAAVPVFARLTLTYRDRPMDEHFRALARLLVDAGTDLITALHDLAGHCRAALDAGAECIRVNVPHAPPGDLESAFVVWRPRGDKSEPVLQWFHPDRRFGQKVAHALVRCGFVGPANRDGSVSLGQGTMEVLVSAFGADEST